VELNGPDTTPVAVTRSSDNDGLFIDASKLRDVSFEMVWMLIKFQCHWLSVNSDIEGSIKTSCALGDSCDLSFSKTTFQLAFDKEWQLTVFSVPSQCVGELPAFDFGGCIICSDFLTRSIEIYDCARSPKVHLVHHVSEMRTTSRNWVMMTGVLLFDISSVWIDVLKLEIVSTS